MRLDRNISPDGGGKYRLWNCRNGAWDADQDRAGENEFFVIKLKDRHARAALLAYAESVREADPEFAQEVLDLAARSSQYHPFCKDPD